MPISPYIKTDLRTFVISTDKCKLTGKAQLKPRAVITCWLVCHIMHKRNGIDKYRQDLKKMYEALLAKLKMHSPPPQALGNNAVFMTVHNISAL